MLTLLLITLICACKSKADKRIYTIPEIPYNVTFCEGDKKLSGVFYFVSPQEMALTLTYPEEAKDYVIKTENGQLSLNFDGVSCSLESLKKLFGSAKGIETLFEIFSSFDENQTFTKSHQKITYPLGEAVISFDESGKLVSVRAGVYDFQFTTKGETT